MIPAVVGYLAAFGLAWGAVAARGFPWTMLLLSCPAVWVIGALFALPEALAIGFYAVIGLAVWATLSGAFLAGLGAVVLALLAWDAAGLALWLGEAEEVPNRWEIWRRFALRSSGLGLIGAATALGFAQLELSLPFWGLVGLLIAAWVVLASLRRAATQRASTSDG